MNPSPEPGSHTGLCKGYAYTISRRDQIEKFDLDKIIARAGEFSAHKQAIILVPA